MECENIHQSGKEIWTVEEWKNSQCEWREGEEFPLLAELVAREGSERWCLTNRPVSWSPGLVTSRQKSAEGGAATNWL
ncbi:hypothetical protein VN12_25580 [Pirellula sp. SH-Sr6A]|nr:hypothetical protein VN12_25580 [Pirellula sp. SH-Sr6A]